MLDEFVELCYNALHLISDKIKNEKLKRTLIIARIPYSLSEYLSFSFVITIFSAVLTAGILRNLVLLPGIFSLCFAIALKIPENIALNYQKQIEESLLEELPITAIELKMKIDFESALERLSLQKTKLGQEFFIICAEINHGKSIPSALKEFAESFDSEFISQTIAQLTLIYNNGNQNISGLEKILSIKKEQNLLKLKEKNQKQAYYSILFVASSTVLPAMFQAYFIVGSKFLNLNYNATIWPAIAVFLMINILLVAKMYEN